jgi:nitrilase
MVSAPEVETNLATAARLVAEAASRGAEVVLLPEYFCILGRRDTDKVAVREVDPDALRDDLLGAVDGAGGGAGAYRAQDGDTGGDGASAAGGDGAGAAGGCLSAPIRRFLAETAQRHGIILIGGTVPLAVPDPKRVLNTTLVHDRGGRQIGRYDKIHLFGLNRGEDRFDESATIRAGRTPVVCDIEHGGGQLRIGLSICYDLRFPELYRRMAPVDLIVVPSAFTYQTGQAHWEILLRARAIENQCYVLAAAQGGHHPNGRRTWGHSMLVDPWGDIVDCLPEGEGVVMGAVDPGRIAEVRRSLPALAHRVL